MRQFLALAVCGLLLSGAQAAEETTAPDKPALRWLPGDCSVPVWPEAEFTAEQRAEQAAKGGLTWMAVSDGVLTAVPTNPTTPLTLKKLTTDTFTPIIGLRWHKPRPISQDIISIGIDPDLPLARNGAQDVIDWTNRLGGAAILADPGEKLERYTKLLQGFAAFEAFQSGKWNPECTIGKSWDRLLAQGVRVFIVGGTSEGTRPVLGQGAVANYVLSRSNKAADIVAAIRLGRVVVAERDNIRLDFAVNGQPPGSTVMPKAGLVEITIDVQAREGVDEVLIIGNSTIRTKTRVQSKAAILHRLRVEGNKTAQTFTLRLGEDTRYLRAYAVMYKGECRTMTNPVFIGPLAPAPLPPSVKDRHVRLIGTALKSLNWQKPAETRHVVEELLGDRDVGVYAAIALTKTLDKKQLDVIRPLLDSLQRPVPALAAFAIQRIEGHAALTHILPMLKTGRTGAIRTYAARMLVKFIKEEHAPTVLDMLRDPVTDIRRCGYIAAASVPSAEVLLMFRGSLVSDYPCALTVTTQFGRLVGLDGKQRDELIEAFKAGEVDDALLNRLVARKDLHEFIKHANGERLWGERNIWVEPPSKADPKFPSLVAVRTQNPPVIDGKVDDKIWDAATPTARFVLEDGKPAVQQTHIGALYDKHALYLFIKCEEPAPKQIVANEKTFDRAVWLDDSVDIYISPSGSREKEKDEEGKEKESLYYRLSVNSLGTRFDEKRRRRHWNAPWTAAAAVGEKAWRVEIKIPFSSLAARTPNKKKTLWLINVARHRRVKPGEESSLAPGDLREPATHATLEFK